MKAIGGLRQKLFWTRDRFSRNVIGNNVNDIREILNNYSSPGSKARRADLLSGLMQHATSTTPFYRQFCNFTSLNDFPVINKNIIRSNYESFRSDRFKKYETSDVITSGSTGVHLIIAQDKRKQDRNTADTIYFLEKGNFKIGNELIYVRKWTKALRKPALLAWLQNVTMVSVTDLSDEYFEKFIRKLKRRRSEKGILSYVSALTQLCRYLDKVKSPPLRCNVTSIIAASESLTTYCKHSMEKYFGVPVISRYSTMENGILAQQFPGGTSDFHINWASYIIEIFDLDEDVPVEHGVLGRIVITDLFNYAMPMIRYDIGDLGIMGTDENGVPVLKVLHGRRMDMIYDTSGKMITPAVVWELDELNGIRQFQLIQTGKASYTIKLNAENTFNADADIILNYKKHFGQDAIITIEKTAEIPVLESGKRKVVCNNYDPKALN
ncbi:MAG TPA: hypothetical protein VGE26_08945 [Sphingobacteriaceae bacterium]